MFGETNFLKKEIIRSLPNGYENMYLESDFYLKAREVIEECGLFYFGAARDSELKYVDLLRLQKIKTDWQEDTVRCRLKREKELAVQVVKKIGELPQSIRWSVELLYRCGEIEFVI